MPSGTKWGAKWQYGWFTGEITLPAEAQGKRIVLDIKTNGESVVYINGVVAGNTRADWVVEQHHFISDLAISKSGVPGEKYEILLESYSGHGRRECLIGPVTPGIASPYEPDSTQCIIGDSTFGIWNETAYQLWLDVRRLLETRNNIDQDSLRVAEIDKGLKDFTLITDFEQPFDKMIESFV